MPKYQMKCDRGHEAEHQMSYEQYDHVKQGELGVGCLQWNDGYDGGFKGFCGLRMEVVLTAIPFVFAVNDKDYGFSKRAFHENLTEI